MKKMVIFLTALVMIAGFSTASFAASIQNSKHDLSTAFPGITNELCVFCHVPHNPKNMDAPLWNHTVSAQNFTLYVVGDPAGNPGQSAAGHLSGLCLGCHDGVTNLDAFGDNGAGTTAMAGGIDANIGTDLRQDHPVMVAYPAGPYTAGGFNDPGSLSVASVYSNFVECASCHNPHDPNGGGGTSTKFLKASNDGSAICLDCHNK